MYIVIAVVGLFLFYSLYVVLKQRSKNSDLKDVRDDIDDVEHEHEVVELKQKLHNKSLKLNSAKDKLLNKTESENHDNSENT